MFNIFSKKQKQGSFVKVKISGMHCVSCAMNIDGALEDLSGVKAAKTNYAKAETVVEYDDKTTNEGEIIKTIVGTGYTAEVV